MRIYFWKQATFFKPLFQIVRFMKFSLNKNACMLKASGLKKSYRSLPVLKKEFIWKLKKGSIVAIVGASGAGKSTVASYYRIAGLTR